MHDELINVGEIYLQDVVCSVVEQNPKEDDFIIYNKVSTMVDINTLEAAGRILEIIKMNKIAFQT